MEGCLGLGTGGLSPWQVQVEAQEPHASLAWSAASRWSAGHTEQRGSPVTLAVLSGAQRFPLGTSRASSEGPAQLRGVWLPSEQIRRSVSISCVCPRVP